MTTVSLNTAPPQSPSWWLPAWKYIRPELLPLFQTLTEIALLTPLAIRFLPWAGQWPPSVLSFWLLLLMLMPYHISRVFTLIGISPGRRRLLLVMGALVIIILNVRLLLYDPPHPLSFAWIGELYARLIEPGNPAIQQDLGVIIFSALAWWRGVVLAGRELDSQRTGRNFRLEIIVVFPVIIFLIGNPLRNMVAPFVLLFFTGSLMTMALTRAQEVEFNESGAAFPIMPGWVARVLGPSVGIALLTGIFTALLTGQQVTGVLGWLSPLWLAFSATLNTVLAILFRAARPLLGLLEWFSAIILEISNRVQVAPIPTPTPDNAALQPTPVPVYDQVDLEMFLQIAGIILVISVLVLVIYLSFRSSRQLAAGREAITGARKQIGTSGVPARPGVGLLNNLRQWRRLRTAATIRRIYENMLIIATQNGFPRLAVETPHEYISSLNQVWPAQHAEISLITQAYVRVRYGEIPETKAEFEAIRTAWDMLRRTPPLRREEDESTDEPS